MTDRSLPGKQRTARWRSGDSTVAASAGAFVTSAAWGDWRGALAVTALKDTSLRLMRFSRTGALRETWKPAALDGTYGRLRTVEPAPDGGLWLTTSNNGDKDSVANNSNEKILHVTLGS